MKPVKYQLGLVKEVLLDIVNDIVGRQMLCCKQSIPLFLFFHLDFLHLVLHEVRTTFMVNLCIYSFMRNFI